MSALFTDHISKAEEAICHHKDKSTSGPSHRKLNGSTLTVSLPDSSKILTGSLVHLLGSRLEDMDRDLTVARPPLNLSDRQSPRSSISDSYCVSCAAGNQVCVHVNAKGTCCAKCETGNRNCVYVTTKKDRLITKLAGSKDFCDRQEGHCKNFNCKNSCLAVDHVHFTNGYPQKKGVNPNYCYPSPEINRELCFLCRSVEFCKKCHKCPNCFPEKMGNPRHQPQSFNSPQRRKATSGSGQT